MSISWDCSSQTARDSRASGASSGKWPEHREHHLGSGLRERAGSASIMSISWDCSSQTDRASRASGTSAGTFLPKLPGFAEHQEHHLGSGLRERAGPASIMSISWHCSSQTDRASRASGASAGMFLPKLPGLAGHQEHHLGSGLRERAGPASIMSISWDCSSQTHRASRASGASAGTFLPKLQG